MTVKQLADREGISKAGVRHILQQLGVLDQVERDEAGILQLTDDQAAAVHAWRQSRKADPESTAESNRQPESADRKAEPDSNRTAAETDRTAAGTSAESDTARLLALLEQDLNAMREQLAVKDAEVLALRQQLDDARLRIDQLTNAAFNLAGKPLLEQDNRSRFRRAWDALRGR